MIDNLSIALTHGLLLIAAWRLMNRPDLDLEDPPEPDKEPSGFASGKSAKGWNGDADA